MGRKEIENSDEILHRRSPMGILPCDNIYDVSFGYLHVGWPSMDICRQHVTRIVISMILIDNKKAIIQQLEEISGIS